MATEHVEASVISGGAARFVGAPVLRKEDRRLLTGHGTYVDDVVVPGMLHAAFVPSEMAAARIKGVDVSAARALPGVRAVLVASDLDGVLAGPIRPTLTLGDLRTSPVPRTLATDDVRYTGEPIAMVIAESRYVAEDACDLVVIDYDTHRPVLDLDEAIAGGRRVHAEMESNVALKLGHEPDGWDGVVASAAHVVSDTLYQHRQNASPMETHGIVASWDRFDERMRVWAATQKPHDIKRVASRALGIPEHRVRVTQQDVGGSFGQKAYMLREEICTIVASFVLGAPVKWSEDRRENLQGLHARHERGTMTVALDADARILGVRLDHLADAGAYPSGTPSVGFLVGMMFPGPYRVPLAAWSSLALWTNTAGRAPYRGPWMAESLVREVMMDRAARAVGLDPLELRRRNVLQPGDLPCTSATGVAIDGVSPAATLEQAAALIGYDELRDQQRRARAEGRLFGIGIGLFMEPSAFSAGISGTEAAAMRIDPSGKVSVYVGTASHGQSLETTLAQVVADNLGVDVADVSVHQGDTDSVPYGQGTGGSRSAVLGGAAVAKAATELRARVIAVAAHLLEADERDLELVDGTVSVRGTPTRTVALPDIAAAAYTNGALPAGIGAGLEVVSRHQSSLPFTLANACHMCACEVDRITGRVTISRYVASEDCGVMINPMVVEGQVAGGVAQGIAGVLYEHLVIDDDGNPLSTTMADYLLPTTAEVPTIEYGHVETPSTSPGGFKGMGEGGVLGSVPAVFNAISDALAPLGIIPTRQPLGPSEIVDLLLAAEETQAD